MKVEASPFFAPDPVLTQTRVFNRFSPRLHQAFDGTMESKKFETSLNVFFHGMLTLELRNVLLFKRKIQPKGEQYK